MKSQDVPAGPLLVDTNVASYLYFKKPNSRWQDFWALMDGHPLAMSFATMGEMLAMTHRNGWGARRRDDLVRHLRGYVVMKYDYVTCQKWAEMHARFAGRLKGQGINDLWTVACALAQNPPMPIVTNDLTDFGSIAKEFPITLIHPDL